MALYDEPNLAADSFGIDLKESFRTAGFGLEQVSISNTSDFDKNMDTGPGGMA